VLLPWADDVAAVLVAWFPGQEAGNALADVLLGDVEPSGRLPVSWPAAEDSLPSTTPKDGVLAYDEGLLVGHRAGDRLALRYAFGHGLGYTTWEYLDVSAPSTLPQGGDVTVEVRLRNTRHACGSRGRAGLLVAYGQRGAAAGSLAGGLRRRRRGSGRGGHCRGDRTGPSVRALGHRALGVDGGAGGVRAADRPRQRQPAAARPSTWASGRTSWPPKGMHTA
jgi:hypothetical protein